MRSCVLRRWARRAVRRWKVYWNKHDYMTRSFQKSASKAIAETLVAGVPVARWDNTCKRAYMEYPDGIGDYGETDRGQASGLDSEDWQCPHLIVFYGGFW